MESIIESANKSYAKKVARIFGVIWIGILLGILSAGTLDAKSIISVLRGDSEWFLDTNGNGAWDPGIDTSAYFGMAGSIPVSGDWDGSGTAKVGWYDPVNNLWYLDYNGNGVWDGAPIDRVYSFGFSGTVPVTGDWNGDGTTKIGAFYPPTNAWFLDYNGNGSWDDTPVDKVYNFGFSGTMPVVADWNGDGRAKIGVYYPVTNAWFLDFNGNGSWDDTPVDKVYNFGFAGTTPVAADWNGDGRAKIGVFIDGQWWVDSNGNGTWDPEIDQVYFFGIPGDKPATASVAPTPPTTATSEATNVTAASAVMNATVNPNGSETTIHFEWGTIPSYGSNTPSRSIGSGTGTVSVSDSIAGLLPGTTYHFRISATNTGGTMFGNDQTFTTPINSISLTIDSPSGGSIINRPDVMVKGTVTNAGGYETGVTVNGIIANIYGSQFVANHVPLQEGSNAITVTATDVHGTTSTASVTVSADTSGKYIRLSTDTESGVAPLMAGLRIDGSFSIGNSSVTVTGPTQPEFLSSSANSYQVQMTPEGMYFFTAIVTGPDGNTYQDSVAVGALNLAAVDNLLRGKWNSMSASLANGDITTALTYMPSGSRAKYQQMYNAIISQLPAMVSENTEFNFVSMRNNVASYELVTLETGGVYSYDVILVKDTNGLWAIQEY